LAYAVYNCTRKYRWDAFHKTNQINALIERIDGEETE
jgi:hypothetical protein